MTDVITTTEALESFCAHARGRPFVTVDTEFMRETTYWPKLCLIQAATDSTAVIIDPMSADLDLAQFLDLMRDTNVLKVFHAARQDIEIFSRFAAIPDPLFDTQIAAMGAGFGEQIAYDALVRAMLGIEIDKSSRFTDWSRRPLSETQLIYALGDVTHLATLYPKLREKLETDGRLAWVNAEMKNLQDPALYNTDPEEAWRRFKPRRHSAKYLAVLKAVAAWRERTAQHRDQPRGRIIKDDAVDELATQAPREPEAFERLRSVPKGFANSRFGQEVIAAINHALDNAEDYAPKVAKPDGPKQPVPGAVVEMLKVLLKARAEDANVASKLIATVADLEMIAVDDTAATPALEGWRRQAFGEDALRLKRGEIALVLDQGKVRVVEVRRAPRKTA